MKVFASFVLVAAMVVPRAALADERAACVSSYEKAQQRKKENRLLESRVELGKCAAETCPEIVRRDCLAWLRETDQTVPTLVVSARTPEGADVIDATVVIDDTPPQKLSGAPMELDPGPHRITVRDARGGVSTQSVMINVGEKNRQVLLTMSAPPAPAAQPDERTPPREAPAKRSIAPWILGGGAVVLGATAGTFWYLGTSQLDDLRGSCAGHCSHDKADPARVKIIVGDVALGVGVVLAAAAVYLALRPSKPDAAKDLALLRGVSW